MTLLNGESDKENHSVTVSANSLDKRLTVDISDMLESRELRVSRGQVARYTVDGIRIIVTSDGHLAEKVTMSMDIRFDVGEFSWHMPELLLGWGLIPCPLNYRPEAVPGRFCVHHDFMATESRL